MCAIHIALKSNLLILESGLLQRNLTITNMYQTLSLKPGKEAPIIFKHPWIFSGALSEIPKDLKSGSLVNVADSAGRIVGTGTYSNHSMIAVRIFEFAESPNGKETPLDQKWFTQKFKEANEHRLILGYGPKTETTAYRVIFGESDGVPGLIVDRYENTLVIQSSTEGIDQLKPEILEALKKVFKPKLIIERSDIPSRHEEGLQEFKRILFEEKTASKVKTTKKPAKKNVKETSEPLSQQTSTLPLQEFKENSYSLIADLLNGQKTGFFLDQKDLRKAVAKYSPNRKVLNLFSYSASASIVALNAKATHVTNLDASHEALALANQNAHLNKIPKSKFENIESDAFQWIGQESTQKLAPEFDLIILDPPALIKSFRDKEEGSKAYHFLNRAALRLIKDKGIFISSSCSHYLTDEDLALILKKASIQAGVELTILEKITQSPDHPLSLYFPESTYLKSFVCLVSRK